MKYKVIAVVICVLITRVTADVTAPPDDEGFACGDFICDEQAGDTCGDITDLGADVTVNTCTPTQNFCYLERTWNGDGTFTYTGNCSATCDSVKEDYTDPNTLWVCCDQYGCNCDGSSLPNDCTAATFPTVASGSFAAPNKNFGYLATLSCDNGFKLVGSSNIECQSNGQWNSTTATCVQITCSAGLLPTLTNGSFSASSTNFGDAATATCESGFALTGSDEVQCQQDETWSTSTAACVKITDCSLSPLPTITDGSFSPSSQNFGDQVNATCDSGYALDGSDPCTIQCQNSGQWTSPTCTCNKIVSAASSTEENNTGAIAGGVTGSVAGVGAVSVGAFALRRFMSRPGKVEPLDV